ncbi:MAG: phosphatase PAP2 family protein [Bacteriovoracia bacterium]
MLLPTFITNANRFWVGALGGIGFLVGYSIPNHYHLYNPILIQMPEWERNIPLMPWTVYIYFTEYALFLVAYMMFKKDDNRMKYLWSFYGCLFIAMVFFIFYPTTYPRADYPLLPESTNWFTYTVFTLLRSIDDPSNSFPSLHVACCFNAAFCFLQKGEARWKFWLFFLWAGLVAWSTLTTKQHYVIDIIGGLVLSLGGYWLFVKKSNVVPLQHFIEKNLLLKKFR